MALQSSEQAVLEQIGDPAKVDREIQQFRKTTMVLSAKQPRLIEQYPKQWIAIHEGKVKVRARTFQSLMTQVDKMKFPREHLVVRFIDKTKRTMIL